MLNDESSFKHGTYSSPIGDLVIDDEGISVKTKGKLLVQWLFSNSTFSSLVIEKGARPMVNQHIRTNTNPTVIMGCRHITPEVEGTVYKIHDMNGIQTFMCPSCVSLKMELPRGTPMSFIGLDVWETILPKLHVNDLDVELVLID